MKIFGKYFFNSFANANVAILGFPVIQRISGFSSNIRGTTEFQKNQYMDYGFLLNNIR